MWLKDVYRPVIEAFLTAWGGPGFPTIMSKHVDAFLERYLGKLHHHETPCVLGIGASVLRPTCFYLADGTKVVVARAPETKGPVWLELQPESIVHLDSSKTPDL